MNFLHLTISFPFILLANGQYIAEPRWGQASVLLGNSLFIQGGKTDPSNGQTYTSAPTNSDVLYLDLSEPFNTSSAPWDLVNSDPWNVSSVLGPSVAWHTINAFNSSHALVFGGLPDSNSQPVVVNQADSAAIMHAFNPMSPSFEMQEQGWAGEPFRRIHHTGVTTPDGKVYLIGGENPNNQDSAYSDNYVFDYEDEEPIFSQLPSGLPDITGHCSVILPNNYVLVFGGYSPSSDSMIGLDTIHVLDTSQSSPSWSTFSTTGTPPSGRRSFACTLFHNNKIYVHGGSDANRMNVFSDGWVLDLSQDTWTWSSVPVLSDLGARSDHFAISTGREVIFGFGYGSFSPAEPGLLIFVPTTRGSGSGTDYEFSGGTWSNVHTPATPGQHDPPYSQTVPPHGTATQPPYTGIGGSSGSHKPTSEPSPTDESPNDSTQPSKDKTTKIAIGTSIGFLALLIGAAVIIHRVRQRREVRREFMSLSGADDDDENGPLGGIPVARPSGEKFSHALLHDDPSQGGLGRDIIAAMGVPALASAINRAVTHSTATQPTRRDMLADEDTGEYGIGAWYDRRRKDEANASSWSLRSIIGGRMRREGSAASSIPPSPHIEKGNPFNDGDALLRDPESGYLAAVPSAVAMGRASSPGHHHDRRQSSYASSFSYTDPFADPIPHTYGNVGTRAYAHQSPLGIPVVDDKNDHDPHSIRHAHAPVSLNTTLPLSDQAHALSPLTESSSRGTLAIPSSISSVQHQKESSSEHNANQSPFETPDSSNDHDTPYTSASSIPSGQSSKAPVALTQQQLKHSSMIDANQSYAIPPNVKRSDTWWARFSKTPLSRRAGDDVKYGHTTDSTTDGDFQFRDPNPPPARLGAIEENLHSVSSSSQNDAVSNPTGSTGSKEHPPFIGGESVKKFMGHGKSVSSLKTIDSEAIERIGGMDVQRIGTGSHMASGSYDNSSRASSLMHGRRDSWMTEEHGYWLPPPSGGHEDHDIVASPTEVALSEYPFSDGTSATTAANPSVKLSSPSSQPSLDTFPLSSGGSAVGTTNTYASQSSQQSATSSTPSGKKPRPPSSGAVAARVQAYEKRFSVDLQNPPREHDQIQKPKATYGLVPKASLFVANPDKKRGSSDG